MKRFGKPSRASAAWLLGALWSFPVLSGLGAALVARTHHRPLGAAVFALSAFGAISFLVWLAWVLLREEAEQPWAGRLRRVAVWGLTIVALAAAAKFIAV